MVLATMNDTKTTIANMRPMTTKVAPSNNRYSSCKPPSKLDTNAFNEIQGLGLILTWAKADSCHLRRANLQVIVLPSY